MRTREAIREKLRFYLDQPQRAQKPADLWSNSVLALVQTEIDTWVSALEWVLEEVDAK